MSRSRDLESHMDELAERARRYANDAGDATRDWVDRGRSAARRFDGDGYRRRIARAAEDLADETSYRYRRVKRHVSRHPVATAAIVAGAIGAFLLLRRALRNNDAD
jgi:hypothetical protein